MDLTTLRGALQRKPFRALRICMASGTTVRVRHPEEIALLPALRSVVIGSHEEGLQILDSDLIEAIEPAAGNGRGHKSQR